PIAGHNEYGLDVGATALDAAKSLPSSGFEHVTALDASRRAQEAARELPQDRVTFVLSRFEEFEFPANRYDLVNAEFSLPFMNRGDFAPTFTALLRSVRQGGIFCGQLFGPNDSWNVENSGMTFHTRAEAGEFFRDFELAHFEEEDHPGTTKLGEPKHWHIFHIIAKKPAGDSQ